MEANRAHGGCRKVGPAASARGSTGSSRRRGEPHRPRRALRRRCAALSRSTATTITRARWRRVAVDVAAARAELERRLGVKLPLAELRYWMLGVPAPGRSGTPRSVEVLPRGPAGSRSRTAGSSCTSRGLDAGRGRRAAAAAADERPGGLKLVVDRLDARGARRDLARLARAGQAEPVPAHRGAPARRLSRAADRVPVDRTSATRFDFEVDPRRRHATGGRVRRTSPPRLTSSCAPPRLLQQRTGSAAGVDIDLRKRIPQGWWGGRWQLGCGDRAGRAELLVGKLGLPSRRTPGRTRPRGSAPTCPCSCRATAAWAEGVGERLTPVEFPERWFPLVRPEVAVSTAERVSGP